MVKTFESLDNEFAASTGSNVNSGSGISTFDYPPNSTKDLLVTSNPGDSSPNTFDVGDTYDLSWSGHGGGGVLEDASVIRSDAAPGEGGIIVFEGTDENGDLVHVVWSPGFDLEGWYWGNYDEETAEEGGSPGFYTTDQNSSYAHSYVCFAADTPILIRDGLKAASQIKAGDQVWTLDDGYQPVQWAGGTTVPGTGRNAPVLFEPGTINNTAPLLLSQQHRVLIRSPLAELFFASHEVLVPAKSMLGEAGICLQACGKVRYVHLLLKHHHILQASGALCESLFLGDMADSILSDQLAADLAADRGQFDHIAVRPMLTYREARSIVGTRLPARPRCIL